MRIIFTSLFALFMSLSCFGQTRTITGRVLNSKNNSPVKNATVIVYGTASGTFTNFLGYFQIELAKDYNELIISHKGYETGGITIPDTDIFSVMLTPEIITLASLELIVIMEDSLKYREVLNSEDITDLEKSDFEIKYSNGWSNFYSELGKEITMDDGFIKENFRATSTFTVTANGDIENISVEPDTVLNKEVIMASLMKMTDWNIRNPDKDPMFRYFQLPIVLTKEFFGLSDKGPLPYGGMNEFYQHIQKELRYPALARRMGIEGKVFVQFNINIDGSLSDIVVLKGIGAGCDKEAMRVVASSPSWIPGLLSGKPVEIKMVLPITFSLGGFIVNKRGYESSPTNFKLGEIDDATEIGSLNQSSEAGTIQNPAFPGGNTKYLKYIDKNRKEIGKPIPPNKNKNMVALIFTIDINGVVKDIKVLKSLDKPFDEEAKRLLANMPKWNPAISNGKPIEKTVTASVDFGNISENKIISAHRNFNNGLNYYKKGNLEKALKQFTLAIEKNPTEVNFYYNRAGILMHMGKINEACSDLKLIKNADQDALDAYKRNCTEKDNSASK